MHIPQTAQPKVVDKNRDQYSPCGTTDGGNKLKGHGGIKSIRNTLHPIPNLPNLGSATRKSPGECFWEVTTQVPLFQAAQRQALHLSRNSVIMNLYHHHSDCRIKILA